MPHSDCLQLQSVWRHLERSVPKGNHNTTTKKNNLPKKSGRPARTASAAYGPKQVIMSGGASPAQPKFPACAILKKRISTYPALTGSLPLQQSDNILEYIDEIIVSFDGDEASMTDSQYSRSLPEDATGHPGHPVRRPISGSPPAHSIHRPGWNFRTWKAIQ